MPPTCLAVLVLVVLLLQSGAECVCTCPVNHSRVVLQRVQFVFEMFESGNLPYSTACLNTAFHQIQTELTITAAENNV